MQLPCLSAVGVAPTWKRSVPLNPKSTVTIASAGRFGHRGRHRRGGALGDHQRVVDRELAGGRVEDRRLDERPQGGGVGHLAPRLGRRHPARAGQQVGRRQPLRRKRVRGDDDVAVHVGRVGDDRGAAGRGRASRRAAAGRVRGGAGGCSAAGASEPAAAAEHDDRADHQPQHHRHGEENREARQRGCHPPDGATRTGACLPSIHLHVRAIAPRQEARPGPRADAGKSRISILYTVKSCINLTS